MSDERSSLSVLRNLPESVKRPIAGLASQSYGLDENGRPKYWTLRRGFVDDLLSMPTLLPELLKLGTELSPASHIPYLGAPMRKQREWLEAHGESLVPEFARDAERRQRMLKRAIRQEMQLSAPEGVVDRTLEGLGTMAGQLPIPANKAKAASSVLGKIFGAIPEYLGPTIKPSASNYVSGAVAGGVLGGGDDVPDSGEYAPVLEQIAKEYPRLGKHLDNVAVERGPDLGDGRQLEYYPPDEEWNPYPGRSTIEIYKKNLNPGELRNLIAGETMHLLGGRNEKGEPVDSRFSTMKDALIKSRTPQQRAIDERVWKAQYANQMPLEDFIQRSRGDEYVMGYLFPDAADEWRKQGTYTDEQKKLLEQMRSHLQTTDEPAQKAHGGYMDGMRMRPRGALRFGYGGAAHLRVAQQNQQAPFGLTELRMNAPSSGAPTTVTGQQQRPFGVPASGQSTTAAPAQRVNPMMAARTRAPQLNMDDYLNYGMRAAKKFYMADGGEVQRADIAINRANEAIRRLSARVQQPQKKADGGKAGLAKGAIDAIRQAIGHLQNRDIRNARAVLQQSKEALAHPEVKQADYELSHIQGRNKGTERLRKLVEPQTPLGLADGGEAALPDSAEDPQMLYVEMQQLIAAVQSGRLSAEEQEQAADRIDDIEQLLTAMGVQLPGVADAGGGLMPGMGVGMGMDDQQT